MKILDWVIFLIILIYHYYFIIFTFLKILIFLQKYIKFLNLKAFLVRILSYQFFWFTLLNLNVHLIYRCNFEWVIEFIFFNFVHLYLIEIKGSLYFKLNFFIIKYFFISQSYFSIVVFIFNYLVMYVIRIIWFSWLNF
jgi:hypothetical protein